MRDDSVVEKEGILRGRACDVDIEEVVVHVQLSRREELHPILLYRDAWLGERRCGRVIQQKHGLPGGMGVGRILWGRDRAKYLYFGPWRFRISI